MTFKEGQRVVFGGFGKPDPSSLTVGTEGTVTDWGENSVQGSWVNVQWDNGSRLYMLLDEGDRITPAKPELKVVDD